MLRERKWRTEAWMSSPIPHGPTFFQSPLVPRGGHRAVGGGAVAAAAKPPAASPTTAMATAAIMDESTT